MNIRQIKAYRLKPGELAGIKDNALETLRFWSTNQAHHFYKAALRELEIGRADKTTVIYLLVFNRYLKERGVLK